MGLISRVSSRTYRFFSRTNQKTTTMDVVCQIAYSRMQGDIIVAAAYSHELPRYGLSVGLKNYAAHYCTGLLLARRVLNKFKLDELYIGQAEADGEEYNVEPVFDDESKEFDAETHCGYIFGSSIKDYMDSLKEENDETYAKQFSKYIKAGIEPDHLEDLYSKVHENIRKDPAYKKVDNKKAGEAKRWLPKKRSLSQRKDRIAQKKASFLRGLNGDEE